MPHRYITHPTAAATITTPTPLNHNQRLSPQGCKGLLMKGNEISVKLADNRFAKDSFHGKGVPNADLYAPACFLQCFFVTIWAGTTFPTTSR